VSASLLSAGRLGDLRRGAGAFLAWWLSELAAMLPPGLRARLHLVRERVDLRVTDEAIELDLVTAEGSHTVRRFPPDGSEAALLVETLEATRGKDRRLVLRLAGRAVLVRELSMPAAVEENLDQVLRYEMDRYTPFKADAVYHGHQVIGRDSAQGRVQVRLVAVPRAFLDHWLQEFGNWGVHPDRVEADQVPGLNLAPARAPVARRRLPGGRALLTGAVVALLVVALLLPLWKLREVVVQLNRDVAQVQQVAARAQDLREQRDQLLAHSRFLIERKQSRPPVVTVLNEMAMVLPDDTWVQSLQFNGHRLVIQGLSGAASGLIGRIEDSPLFESVSFAAPVTRDRATGRDVFQIALSIREASS
jgi:general secretion pathway protein L